MSGETRALPVSFAAGWAWLNGGLQLVYSLVDMLRIGPPDEITIRAINDFLPATGEFVLGLGLLLLGAALFRASSKARLVGVVVFCALAVAELVSVFNGETVAMLWFGANTAAFGTLLFAKSAFAGRTRDLPDGSVNRLNL